MRFPRAVGLGEGVIILCVKPDSTFVVYTRSVRRIVRDAQRPSYAVWHRSLISPRWFDIGDVAVADEAFPEDALQCRRI